MKFINLLIIELLEVAIIIYAIIDAIIDAVIDASIDAVTIIDAVIAIATAIVDICSSTIAISHWFVAVISIRIAIIIRKLSLTEFGWLLRLDVLLVLETILSWVKGILMVITISVFLGIINTVIESVMSHESVIIIIIILETISLVPFNSWELIIISLGIEIVIELLYTLEPISILKLIKTTISINIIIIVVVYLIVIVLLP